MNHFLVATANSHPADLLSTIANLASVAGFLLTIWVWLKVRHIEGHFLFRVRFPAIKRQINGHSRNISLYLNSFPTSANDLEVELKKCQSDLKNLRSKLKGDNKASVTKILEGISQLSSPLQPNSIKDIRDIYLSLVILEKDLENLKEDMQWRTQQ